MSQGEKAPSFNVIPHVPQERYLKVDQGITVAEGVLSIRSVNEYRKYASVLTEANPALGFTKELAEIKEKPLQEVNQGSDIELLKLNSWIRDVNNAARISDTKLFEKAVKNLLLFLSEL